MAPSPPTPGAAAGNGGKVNLTPSFINLNRLGGVRPRRPAAAAARPVPARARVCLGPRAPCGHALAAGQAAEPQSFAAAGDDSRGGGLNLHTRGSRPRRLGHPSVRVATASGPRRRPVTVESESVRSAKTRTLGLTSASWRCRPSRPCKTRTVPEPALAYCHIGRPVGVGIVP